MKFFKKIFFVVAMSVVFFWNIAPVMAAPPLKVEFNPLCWEKQECQDARAKFVGSGNAKSNSGWLENVDPCNKAGWGMCLPINATKAQISFGGDADFSDAGVYIKTVYNYSLVIIGILAVVMIIISGAQWITSAGNSERIGAAKKRITGAIIGLFIAYMSYNILMSINPATINLRLPQIYMIRQTILASKWCRDLQPEQEYYFAADFAHQLDKVEATGSESVKLKYPYNMAPYTEFFSEAQPEKFLCGQRYFMDGASADQTCWGDKCPKGLACLDVFSQNSETPNYCGAATIYGSISGFVAGTLEGLAAEAAGSVTWEYLDGNMIYLFLACESDGSSERPYGTSFQIPANTGAEFTDSAESKSSYRIYATPADIDAAVASCGGESMVRGAFMEMNFVMNVSSHFEGENHMVGKGGVDMWGAALTGDNAAENFFTSVPTLFKKELFIPLASLRSGVDISFKADAIEPMGVDSGAIIVTVDEDKVYNQYKKNMIRELTAQEIDNIDEFQLW